MGKRIAVVTGTSRGIGRAIAKQLADRGMRVIATSRDETKGKRTADELGLEFFPLDVSQPNMLDALAKHVEADGVDVLVNNAGVALDGFDAAVVRRTVEVNFFGAVRTTDRLLPMMRAGGRIVMVSSGMGELACLGEELRDRFRNPLLQRDELMALATQFGDDVAKKRHEKNGWPSNAYRVSKVALNAYVRILARELTDDARMIKVNAACPGWVRTDMGGASAPRTPDDGAKTPVWLATLPEDGAMGGFFRDEHALPW